MAARAALQTSAKGRRADASTPAGMVDVTVMPASIHIRERPAPFRAAVLHPCQHMSRPGNLSEVPAPKCAVFCRQTCSCVLHTGPG